MAHPGSCGLLLQLTPWCLSISHWDPPSLGADASHISPFGFLQEHPNWVLSLRLLTFALLPARSFLGSELPSWPWLFSCLAAALSPTFLDCPFSCPAFPQIPWLHFLSAQPDCPASLTHTLEGIPYEHARDKASTVLFGTGISALIPSASVPVLRNTCCSVIFIAVITPPSQHHPPGKGTRPCLGEV